MPAPTSITARCPTCNRGMDLAPPTSSEPRPVRQSCQAGHRWAITINPGRQIDVKGVEGWVHTVTFTPLKPGRTLAAAREELIKEALRKVPQLRRAEWKKAGPAARARMIKSYVEAHTKEA